MKILLRCWDDYRIVGSLGVPLLILAVLLPLASLAMPLVEREVIDGVILANKGDRLPVMLVVYAGVWLVMTLIHLMAGVLRPYLTEKLARHLRLRLLSQCQALSVAFARREHSGQIMALFAGDVPTVAHLFTTSLLGIVGCLVTTGLAAVVMFYLNWRLALVAGVLPPVVAGLAALVTRPLRPASRRSQQMASDLMERLQENLSGLREVVAFGQGQTQARRFTAVLEELVRLRMRVSWMETALGTGQSLLLLVVSVAILGYGGYLVVHDHATLGTIVAMRSLFSLMYQPATQVFGLFATLQKGLASADRLYDFLDRKPQVLEHLAAIPAQDVRGAVSFASVSFAYQPDRPVLREVTLSARPGEMIALVGPSGAGKTTLVSLIARFYDPTAGRVLLDGADLRDLTLAGLREHISFVFQDSFLFDATIRENIAFGREGATEAEIVAAAHAANAWEFIEALPEGLDTRVGERGVRLSEGQKQRIAIARAFLRDPRILILDEPTSALDARSEHLLQSALDRLRRGRTTFVIAHRLATVQQADRIVVLDQGRVVEQGTHAELLRSGGLYRELYDLQFSSSGVEQPHPEGSLGVPVPA